MNELRTVSAPPVPEAFVLRKKVLRLETLYDISRALAVLRDEDSFVEEVAARSVALLDAARGFAVTFEGSGSPGAISAVGFNMKPDAIALASDSFVLDLCRIVAPLQRENEMVLGRRVRSAVGVPFVTRGHVVGALVLMDREARSGEPSTFDEEDGRFLASLAALAAPALEALRQLRALSFDIDRLREENRALKGTLGVDEVLVGDSLPMRRVKDLIARAASSRANVLIRGESGTGKELAAKLLHSGSPRRDAPFLALNCAAVPEPLLESELFGIEKGVATGVEARMGKLELANGGTVFLDEIADAPLAIQAKLLRVLQEREIERLGGRQRIPVDVRVLSATHADLSGEIQRKRFREDLYYRLRVVEIIMPALRDRREDIPRLAGHFLTRIAQRDGRRPLSLSRDAVAGLLGYPFPGNVRELENLLEGAAALVSGDVIESADLQFGVGTARPQSAAAAAAHQLDLAAVERDHIQRVLDSVDGNKSHAARLLGINRRTLYRKNVS